MLRKTNYNRNDANTTNYDFNSNNQQTFQPPKLRPTGRKFEEGTQYGGANKFGGRSQQQATSSYEDTSNNYAEADNSEVTFTGDAFDI